jgi:glucose/arabinose dehydrogenase
MKSDMFAPRSLWLAGAFFSAFTLAAAAQQPASPPAASPAPAPSPSAAAPLPPGSPVIGRPADNEAAAKLAPIASPPIPAAADKLPTAKLKVPAGFNIEVYASGIANARSLAEGDKGTIFVGSRLVGNVYAITTDQDGKRTVKTIASGLHRPNGVAFKNGTLYIAELSKVSKVEKAEDNLDSPAKLTTIYDNLPKDEAHGWKFIAIGPDNKLHIPVGQPGNNVLHDDAHGQIRRIIDGSGAEVIARGVRNTVGFDWNPETKQLYFTDNGRDWVSEDVPEDELNRITKVGEHFGAPYCLQGNIADPEHGWGKSCADYTAPVGLLGPHAAALGMRFYTGKMFPAAYKNQIIVARRGSWNRSKKVGGDVLLVKLNKDGTMKSTEPLITGFLEDNKYIGRPVDVLQMKDGSLLVSDDWNGAVYRVTYGKQKVADKK